MTTTDTSATASPSSVDAGLLACSGLSAGYGDIAAIRDVSLCVRRGEVVGLFGPNGAGKSTTLRALAGVIPYLAGTVTWHGRPRPREQYRLARAGLAFIPEGRSVTASLSVRDNLRLGRGSIASCLDLFPELQPLLERRAGLLSGGEQQMLVLGRAIAARPAVLLVDELSLGLAPLVVDRLLAVLRDAADRDDLAVVLVEQQLRRAQSVIDRWYLLHRGVVHAAGDRAGGADELTRSYGEIIGGGRATGVDAHGPTNNPPASLTAAG